VISFPLGGRRTDVDARACQESIEIPKSHKLLKPLNPVGSSRRGARPKFSDASYSTLPTTNTSPATVLHVY
jgi:hypothetical protein